MEISKIIFDTDCICSFLWVNEEDALVELFYDKIYIPEAVKNEIERLKDTKYGDGIYKKFNEKIENNEIKVLIIEMGSEEEKLVEKIKCEFLAKFGKIIGDGELHMVALAIHNNATCLINTASNNLKDIGSFIKNGEIKNITTMDILCLIYEKKSKSLEELEFIKQEMIKRKRRLPKETVEEYYRKNFKK